MKKLLAILTLAAVVCVGSASILADHKATHSFDYMKGEEKVKITGLLTGHRAVISVEARKGSTVKAWNDCDYTRVFYLQSSSKSLSAKNIIATNGFYAYYTRNTVNKTLIAGYGEDK